VVNTTSQAVPTAAQGTTTVAGTVTIGGLPGPAVVVEQTVQINPVTETVVGPFDVSRYTKIRVFYQFTAQTGDFFQCTPEVLATNGTLFLIDDPMFASSFPATKVYDVPGPSFRLFCVGDASNPGTLKIAIYGSTS
jgi:hypothetical protein